MVEGNKDVTTDLSLCGDEFMSFAMLISARPWSAKYHLLCPFMLTSFCLVTPESSL